MADISEIFEIENKKETTQTKEKRSRKKKDYTEEEKQKIKERLKLGKLKAAEARNATQEKQKSGGGCSKAPTNSAECCAPSTRTKEDLPKHEKKQDTKPEESSQVIREKIITKHILELDETDGIDAKELKQFLSKLYKASKQKVVVDAMNNYEKPAKDTIQQEPKSGGAPSTQTKEELKSAEPIPKTIPKPEQPKQSKEELKAIQDELAYQERMAKLKKQLANKKRR